MIPRVFITAFLLVTQLPGALAASSIREARTVTAPSTPALEHTEMQIQRLRKELERAKAKANPKAASSDDGDFDTGGLFDFLNDYAKDPRDAKGAEGAEGTEAAAPAPAAVVAEPDPAEVAKVKVEVEKLEAELAAAETEHGRHRQAARAELIQDILELKSPHEIRYAHDYMRGVQAFLVDPQKTVSVLSGNAVDEPSEKQVSEVTAAVSGLVDRGYTVFFDRDSKMAPSIAQAAGKQGVGFTGDRTSSHADASGGISILIENPYIRMKALERAHRSVATPDSVIGTAMMIRGKLDRVLDSGSGEAAWADPFQAWDRALRDLPNLGLKYDPTRRSSSAEKLLASHADAIGKKPNFPKVTPEANLAANFQITPRNLTYTGARDLLEYVTTMLDGETHLGGGPAGAVFFGSSGTNHKYNELVYDASHAIASLGIPVATGGADGFMKIANQAAFHAGAESIGIPIGGDKTFLANERRFPTELHTRTYVVTDYPTRIPLLIKDKQLVVFAPGGGGTMKELATVFTELAAHPHSKTHVIFVGQDYYGLIADYFQRAPLPDYLKRKLTVVADANALEAEVSRGIQAGEYDLGALKQEGPLTPRGAKPSFEIPKASASAGRDDDYGYDW